MAHGRGERAAGRDSGDGVVARAGGPPAPWRATEAAPFAGPLLVLAGAVLWGTTGTAQALGPPGVPPPVVGAARLAIGGLGLLVVAAATGALPRWTALAGRGQRGPLFAAVAAVALYQATFFSGVDRAGVALGTAVAIGSAPAFTGVLGWAARRERPEPGWGTATALAIAGCALLLLPQGGVRVDAAGIALALVAGACFATGTVAMKSLLDQAVPATGVVAAVFGGAGLVLLPVLLGGGVGWLASPRGAGAALYLGLAATTLAYVCFSRGLSRVASASAATLSLAEPLTAALLGLLLLAERPGPLGYAGGALVLAGLVILALAPRWRLSRRR